MLKAIRNRLVLNPPAQAAIRESARRGLLPRSIYRRLPPNGRHPITSPGGHTFLYETDPTDMMARGVVWENLRHWEVGSLREFSRLVADCRLFLDVGAYSGMYSLIACADGPGRAIAFEPNPAARRLLDRNIAVNGWNDRIEVVSEAVSDRAGTGRLAIPFDTTAARLGDRGIEVGVTTIDAVVGDRPVDVIKVDVEGREVEVLTGGANVLRRDHPALILEVLHDDAFRRITDVVADFGYGTCHHLSPSGAVKVSGYVAIPRHANFLWAT